MTKNKYDSDIESDEPGQVVSKPSTGSMFGPGSAFDQGLTASFGPDVLAGNPISAAARVARGDPPQPGQTSKPPVAVAPSALTPRTLGPISGAPNPVGMAVPGAAGATRVGSSSPMSGRTHANRASARLKQAETQAGSGSPATPPLRVTRLKTLDDIRVELAKVYREARTRTLDLADAKGLSYILTVMSALVKDTALEERIAALEAKVEHLYSILGEQPPPS